MSDDSDGGGERRTVLQLLGTSSAAAGLFSLAPEWAAAAAEDLVLESVVVDGVQAVTDDQYDFVQNLPTADRGGTEHVLVKFPREELVDALGAGEHRPAISGAFGRTSVRGSADLTVVEPGSRDRSGDSGR